MHKCYLAVVHGIPKEIEGTLSNYFYKEPRGNLLKIVAYMTGNEEEMKGLEAYSDDTEEYVKDLISTMY